MRPLTLALGAVLLLYVGLAWSFLFVCDDAFISYRYAWQWAHGHGIRFNVTNARPVEGYSDFLWVAVAALFERLDVRSFRVMPLLSIACGALQLVLVERIARGFLGVRAVAAWAVVLLLAVSPSYVVWGTSGLETMAHASFWLLAWYGLGPSGARWGPAVGGLALLASMLLRAEGFAWGGGVLLAAGLARWSQGRRPTEGWTRPLVAVGVAYVAYQIWRIGYYGRPFPNTVYAKVDPSLAVFERGLRYVLGFFVTTATPTLVLPALALARGRRPWRLLPIVVLAAGPMGFAVMVGGDFMTFWRLLVPGLAPLALLAAPALDALAARRPRLTVVVTLLIALVGALPLANRHVAPHRLRMAFDVRGPWPDISEFDKWESMRDAPKGWFVEGVALREITEPGDSVVLGAIGATGYAAPHVVIFDLFGLVTPEVSKREIRPRDLTTPGHDKEVTVGFFYDDRPSIFGFKLFRVSDLQAGVGEELRMMRRLDPKDVYVPELRKVEAVSQPGCAVVALTLRYTPDTADRVAAREAFDLAKGKIEGGRPDCAGVDRLRDSFPRLSREPIVWGHGDARGKDKDKGRNGRSERDDRGGRGG